MTLRERLGQYAFYRTAKNVALYSLIAFVVVVALSDTVRHIFLLLGYSSETSELVSGLLEATTAVVGTAFVAYQLGQTNDDARRARDIEEASFLLELNKSFIENEDMVHVEQDLERNWLGTLGRESLITDKNRQNFINYLVYLEGIAPFILRDILHFETIDDLMAYRFYLAVNNPELQKDQLIAFPEYYRGCFKLYAKWTRYRRSRGFEILNEEHGLDHWDQFYRYAHEHYCSAISEVRNPKPEEYVKVGELIFNTDPYIYPRAFESAKRAGTMLARVMDNTEGLFSHRNAYIALDKDGSILGVAVCIIAGYKPYAYKPADFLDEEETAPKYLGTVCGEYFNKIAGELTDDTYLYTVCLSVDEKSRGKGVGSTLLDKLHSLASGKPCKLDCLAGNRSAIRLYKRKGYRITSYSSGFSISVCKPLTVAMIKR